MQHRTILFLVTAALVTPAAAAWSVNGAFEPDTAADIASGRMFLNADASPDGAGQVYFNALPSDRNGAANMNPNVGTLETRYLPAGQMGMTAYLGVWLDCNGDSYIGYTEGALFEYPSQLLTDDTACPPGSAHHSDGWVTEFITISPVAKDEADAANAFPKIFVDEAAGVWGDFGRPDVVGEVHYDCAQAPFQAGSFDNTGGFLRYFDCQAGYNIAQAVNDVDAQAGLGIGFDDKYNPGADCDNPLNQEIGMYGRSPCNPDDPGTLEYDTTPMASVWDCQSAGTTVPDPTTGDPVATVPAVAAGEPNADGSAYRAARDAAFPCGANEQDVEDLDTIDPFGAGGRLFNGEFLLGADFSATNPVEGKRVADFELEFTMPAYGVSSADPALGGIPGLFGVRGPQSGPWDSSVTYLPPTYLGGTVRNDNLEPAGGLWFTFYATVGSATLDTFALPSETPATYGAEACPGGQDEGISAYGWDCDPTHWWNPEMGGSAAQTEIAPRPGTAYYLRDTDCYDGRLAEGVYASLALLSTDPLCG